MLRSLPVVLMIAAFLAASLAQGFGATFTYSGTFTNGSAKTWIAYHIECTNAIPRFEQNPTYPPTAYNTAAPGQLWAYYQFEQGTNFYQKNGFLVYPKEGSGLEILPGQTLSLTFPYQKEDETQPSSFNMYPVTWPLNGTMVTVTPENMASLGWSVATNRNATAGLVKYGCAIYEANRGLITENENINLGKGTFYATLDYSGGPGTSGSAVQSATAWLGLDKWNGQPLAGITLNRITKMKYFGFVSKEPTRTTGGANWDSYDQWWIGPRQPICLEITAENPNDPSDRRQFWFRPWQTAKISGDNCRRQAQRWLWYDCIDGTPQVQVTKRWYCYRGLSPDGTTSLDEVYGTWADLIAVYGDWKLVQTSTTYNPAAGQYKSAGWDNQTTPPGTPTCSATGKCINFQVGARKGVANVYGPENGTDTVNWAGYYWGFRGHVDFFTLGIDGVDITYDFEPSPTEQDVQIVGINQLAQFDPIMGSTVIGYNNAPVRQYPHLLDYYPVRLTGKVVERYNAWFALEDGTNPAMRTRVYLIRDNNNTYAYPQYSYPVLGQTWTVFGFLEQARFRPDQTKPWCLWTNIYNCQKIK